MYKGGKSIRIYLQDGSVTGIKFGEVVNQTIQMISCPRNRINELKLLDEAKRPGIYFLFGIDEETGNNLAYIGEAENVIDRLQQHLNGKDFWNEVIFFISKDENLTKSHVRYLESKIIQIANTTNRYIIQNGNKSQPASLPAGDRDAMEEYLIYLKLLLGVFGHRVLEDLTSVNNSKINNETLEDKTSLSQQISNQYYLKILGLNATAVSTDEGIVVLEGSDACLVDRASLSNGYKEFKEKLINTGVLIKKEGKYSFTKNQLFPTASPAAALIVGYAINGRDHWKDKTGRTLNQIENSTSI